MTDSVRAIQELVAEYYELPIERLLSKQRTRDVCRPRQIAMWLSAELTTRSLPDIGKRFGDMDHTTVMHACKRIAKLAGELAEIRRIAQARIASSKVGRHVAIWRVLKTDMVWRYTRVAFRVGCRRADRLFSARGYLRYGDPQGPHCRLVSKEATHAEAA